MNQLKVVLYFSFTTLFLLTLILGESFVFFYLVGAYTLLTLFGTVFLKWERLSFFTVEYLAWLLFITGIIISSLFSHHLPLSLYKTTFILVGFMMCWFFTLLDEKAITRRSLYLSYILNGVVLGALSILFYLVPQWASTLPGMNLLFPSYGHNHLASYLLLVLPLVYYFYFRSSGQRGHFFLSVIIFFTSLVIVSFGRVATFLGLIQLGTIAYHQLPQLGGTLKGKVILGVMALLSVTIVVQQLFSFNLIPCLTGPYQTKLCKPIAEEPRGYYWQQAVAAIKDYMMVGYGPGTFQLINTRYKQLPATSTAYAHNTWLELWAEAGGVGVVPAIILVLILARSVWLIPAGDEKFFLSLSVITLIGNSFFDFDFSYLGIYLGTLIVTALLLKTNTSTQASVTISPRWLKASYYLVVSGLLLISLCYLVTDVLLRNKQTQTAWKMFPYFSYHQPLFMGEELDQGELDRLYHYDPAWHRLTSKTNLDEETMALLLTIDPWGMYTNSYAVLNDSLSDRAWEIYIAKVRELDRQRLTLNPNVLAQPHTLKKEVMEKMMTLAGKKLSGGDLDLAIDYYRQAYAWDHWALARRDLQPALTALSPEQTLSLISHLDFIEPSLLGNNRELIGERYHQAIVSELQSGQVNLAADHVPWLLEIAPWDSYRILNSVNRAYEQKLLTLTTREERQELVEAWAHFLIRLHPYKDHYPFRYRNLVGSELITLGNEALASDGAVTARNYELISQLESWLLTSQPLWFDEVSLTDVPVAQLEKYGEAMAGKKNDQLGWRNEDHAVLFLTLVTHYSKNQDLDKARAMMDAYQTVGELSGEQVYPFQKELQQLALANPGDTSYVATLITLLKEIDATNYWTHMQLGNYYVWWARDLGSDKKRFLLDIAKEEYQQCLEAFSMNHSDCQTALEMIEQGNPEYQKYQDVAQKIVNQ